MTLKYIVEGFKWFDKINGNTYHSVNIINAETKDLIYQSGLTYGYGEQWRHTAIDGLIKMGLFAEKDRHNHDLIRDIFYFTCQENCLKRDLSKKEFIKVVGQ